MFSFFSFIQLLQTSETEKDDQNIQLTISLSSLLTFAFILELNSYSNSFVCIRKQQLRHELTIRSRSQMRKGSTPHLKENHNFGTPIGSASYERRAIHEAIMSTTDKIPSKFIAKRENLI